MNAVDIIMATYNGESYLGEQIDSILSSSFQNFKLLIFDDGSKDSTVSILKEYEKKYPLQIQVYQNEQNLGLTNNFLQALCKTTADYIMFCDQDDCWMPSKIELTLNAMVNEEKRAGKRIPLAVFTDAKVVDQNLVVLKESFFKSTHLNPMKTDLSHILMENKLIGCTVMVNSELRKIIQEHPLPKKAKYHDWWVALIAASMGRICFVDEQTLLYRQHGGNMVGGTGFISYVKNRLSTFQKQREAVRLLYQQAQEFLNYYQPLLTQEKQDIIDNFIKLEEYSFIKRRGIILRNGYLKTGILRNIGLMIIV